MDNLKTKILEIFEIDDLDESTNIRLLEEWDSLTRLSLQVLLEDDYGLSISEDEFEDYVSLKTLNDRIALKTNV